MPMKLKIVFFFTTLLILVFPLIHSNAQLIDPSIAVKPIVKVEVGYSRTLVCTYAYTITQYQNFSEEREDTDQLGQTLTYKLLSLPNKNGFANIETEGIYVILNGNPNEVNFWQPGSYFVFADWEGWKQFSSNSTLSITTQDVLPDKQVQITIIKYFIKTQDNDKIFEFFINSYSELKMGVSVQSSIFNGTYMYDKQTGSLVYSHEIKDNLSINASVITSRSFTNYEFKDLSYDFGNTEALSFNVNYIIITPAFLAAIILRKRIIKK